MLPIVYEIISITNFTYMKCSVPCVYLSFLGLYLLLTM